MGKSACYSGEEFANVESLRARRKAERERERLQAAGKSPPPSLDPQPLTPHPVRSFLPPSPPSPPPLSLASILAATSSRRASARWWSRWWSGRNRCLPRGAARDLGERRHGCSLLQALRLLVAAPLQIADARYPPTARIAIPVSR
jgi:hypothetical protein